MEKEKAIAASEAFTQHANALYNNDSDAFEPETETEVEAETEDEARASSAATRAVEKLSLNDDEEDEDAAAIEEDDAAAGADDDGLPPAPTRAKAAAPESASKDLDALLSARAPGPVRGGV